MPLARPNAKKIAGWCDNVKESRDKSLFWHWVWLEAGKPMTGHVYCIMKRTRHRYHYAVRCAKRKSTETTRIKLAKTSPTVKIFGKNFQKLMQFQSQLVTQSIRQLGLQKFRIFFLLNTKTCLTVYQQMIPR